MPACPAGRPPGAGVAGRRLPGHRRAGRARRGGAAGGPVRRLAQQPARQRHHPRRRVGRVAGDDVARRQAAQPGELALGELAGRRRAALVQLAVEAAVERRPGLPVADGAHRGQPGVQVAPRAQPAHLVDEAGVEHGPKAQVDAPPQPLAVGRLQRDQRRVRKRLCRGDRAAVAQVRRQRHAADAVHLERALDALRVAGGQARGGDGVDALQFLPQRVEAVARELRGEPGAHLAVGRGQRVEALEQRLEVEHRAADEQRQRAARGDAGDQPLGVGDEARRRVRLGRVEDVDQVVRHARALGGRGLGGADVHAAVDERRVDADDLDRPAVGGERLGDGQRGGGLAGGGGAGEAEVPGQGAARRRGGRGEGGDGRLGAAVGIVHGLFPGVAAERGAGSGAGRRRRPRGGRLTPPRRSPPRRAAPAPCRGAAPASRRRARRPRRRRRRRGSAGRRCRS